MNTGYGVEPAEVAALRDSRLAEVLDEPDPIRRYHELTREQRICDALVSEIKRLRGVALDEARGQGLTLAEVAEAALLGSRQRAEQLIANARGRKR